jgi:cysteinyl-tRNA synthetase
VLYRLLKATYSKVTYVRNITDVDDKIIKAAKDSGKRIGEITKEMTDYYHHDIAALNCLNPDQEPKATEHIDEMIAMIQKLIDTNHAYVAEGHVLFSVESYKGYGHLAGRSLEEMIAGARVEVAPYKKNPADFVLWKPITTGEEESGFDSPWGKGRPGWHIECSAMSKKHLGDEFDIHGGGADLMFPHHENEVAQSTCANSKQFVKYWVHNGFLTVEGEKMSKSLGNFKTVKEVLDQGVEGVVIRYVYLTTHYKKPLDYSQKAVDDAKKAIEKFRLAIGNGSRNLTTDINEEILQILTDDMNAPLAISKLHEYAILAIKGDQDARQKLQSGCELLGLNLSVINKEIPKDIVDLAEARLQAKKDKNWSLADELRDKISALGYSVKDTKDGYKF